MSTADRSPADMAREELAAWIKAYHTRRPVDMLAIEGRRGLEGMTPAEVTAALAAAACARAPLGSESIEGSE